MSLLVTYFLCRDTTSLGRVDFHSLPQQALMEIMISDLIRPDLFRKECGQYHKINRWSGLLLTSDENVKAISWSHYQLKGTIYFEWVPETVEKFVVDGNRLRCTINLYLLDRTALKTLNVDRNELHGSVDLTHLPQVMESLSLAVNQLTGSIDLTRLPDSLRLLDLRLNQLSGSVNLTKLPKMMNWLNIMNNELEGTIDLSSLPQYMRNMYLNHNAFEGDLRLSHLPSALHWIDLSENQLQGEVCVEQNLPAVFKIELGCNGPLQLIDIDGNPYFSRNIMVDQCPPDLESVN